MGDRSVILKPLPYKLGVILSLQTTSTTHWPVRRSELLVGISTKSNSKRVPGDKLSYVEIISPCSEQSINKPRYSLSFCRSEEHTSELQSRPHLVCRLL